MVSQVTAFVSRQWRVPSEQMRVAVQPVHGGLESEVSRVRILQTD